jgi:arylsulfatase A-like enzyme
MSEPLQLSRRNFILTALAAAGQAIPATAWAATQPPNVVFILADDMGYGDPGVYGQLKIKTPNIDKLAAEGMRFTQGYAGAPVCAPSRCALMTGMHTGHTRVRDNFALAAGTVGYKGKEEIRRASLLPSDKTVADYMKAAGYHTGLMGKWHLDGYDPAAIPTRHGFDEFKGWLTQNAATQGYYPAQRYVNETLVHIPENADGKHGLYETFMVTDHSIDFIERHKVQPFFLYVAYDAPHSPYIAPDFGPYANEPWLDDEKTYAAMIHYLDQGVGKIMASIKTLGLDGNTIVFFASDNGPRSEPTPQQSRVISFFDSNAQLLGYKRDVYEGGIRDPLIARWPDHIPAATVSDLPAYFPDFLPTALALANAPAEPTDGMSLLPFLLNPRLKGEDRFLYWEFYEPQFCQSARLGKWKAVRLRRSAKLELYDLSIDPSEEHNLAAQHPDVVARIEALMAKEHRASPEYPDLHATAKSDPGGV